MLKTITLGLLLTFGAAHLGATVLYTDFGAADSYDAASADSVFGTPPGTDRGAAFVISSDATFTSLRVAVSLTSGTNSVTVALRNNSAGSPGSVIESFTLTSLTSSSAIYTLTSVTNPTLSGGTTYWVTIFPGGSNTSAPWYVNNQGIIGLASSFDGGTTWSNQAGAKPTLEINGTLAPVPEPSTSMLFLGGLGAVGLLRLRKKA